MIENSSHPKILFVTPEVANLPAGAGEGSDSLMAKARGMADVSADLMCALYDQGADVHVVLPDYRLIFNNRMPTFVQKELNLISDNVPDERIHFARDRAFAYLNRVDSGNAYESLNISLVFQRDVINNIVPNVRPDLIHCYDWTCGLIPAMARQLNIPCLFTIHNIQTMKATLAQIENVGIDAASFWQWLYYMDFPSNYENTRSVTPVDFLTSGVFAAHFINTLSPTFLDEMIKGRHHFVEKSLQQELANKRANGCAMGILNSPEPSFHPSIDEALASKYDAENHVLAKESNKKALQQALGLIADSHAPVFFWPSRLDPAQRGCQLLAEILYHVVSKYWDENLQIVFVADGEYHQHFSHIAEFHNFSDRVAVRGFNEQLARLAYGAADFVLVPSFFEPGGLSQMISVIYGALPVANDTGGIHDTVSCLDVAKNTGNGFLFKIFNAQGLSWAIDQAMKFYRLPLALKERQISRIMRQGAITFNYQVTAQQYIVLYENLLKRPLIDSICAKNQAGITTHNTGRQL